MDAVYMFRYVHEWLTNRVVTLRTERVVLVKGTDFDDATRRLVTRYDGVTERVTCLREIARIDEYSEDVVQTSL